MEGPDPSVTVGQCGKSRLRGVPGGGGGWLCVSVIPGKDDVYSSSEGPVAGRDKQVQEGHFWVDETA